MATQSEIIEKLDKYAEDTQKVSVAYDEVLTSEGEQDITLYDGRKTPNLNKRLAGMAKAVSSVNGKTGAVKLTREDFDLPSDEYLARLEKEARFVITSSGRTQEEKNKENISVLDFGAKGSNTRLGSAYSALAEAQATYPTAKSLNDTFDIVAFEKALIAHNTVHIPNGTYHFNRELRLGSNKSLIGSGIKSTKILMTADAYTKSCGITTIGCTRNNTTAIQSEFITLKDFTIDGNRKNRLVSGTSSINEGAGIDWNGTGVSGSNIGIAFARYVNIERVLSVNATLHNFDISSTEYYKTGEGHQLDWQPTPSSSVTLTDCIASDPSDDNFTTHWSHHITFNNCIALNGGNFENSNGFEIDDGSYDVTINGGWAYLCCKGVQIKAHEQQSVPHNINVNNFLSAECNVSFSVENYDFSEVYTAPQTAFGVNLNNCISITPRKLNVTERIPRHLYITGYTGVNVSNFVGVGKYNSPVPMLNFDTFDISDVSFSNPQYSDPVIQGGVDVTYSQMQHAIFISSNARNVNLNSVYVCYEDVTGAVILVGKDSRNVSLKDITIEKTNVSSPANGGLAVVYQDTNCTQCSVDGLNAYNPDNTNQVPVYRTVNAIGLNNANSWANVSGVGYTTLTRFGSIDHTTNTDMVGATQLSHQDVPDVPNGKYYRTGSALGNFLEFYYNASNLRGAISVDSGAIVLTGTRGNSIKFSVTPNDTHTQDNWTGWQVTSAGGFSPHAANTQDIGSASLTVKNLYIQNSPIVSSDERLKQQFRSQSEAEKLAALEIKASICLYKFTDAVDLKGDGARWHVGVKAQQVVSILESHGLNPFEYAFVCFDEWYEQEEIIETWDDEYNEDGNLIREAGSEIVQEYREAGSRYAIRYDELSMFILSSI